MLTIDSAYALYSKRAAIIHTRLSWLLVASLFSYVQILFRSLARGRCNDNFEIFLCDLLSACKFVIHTANCILLLMVALQQLLNHRLVSACSHAHQSVNGLPEILFALLRFIRNFFVHMHLDPRWKLFRHNVGTLTNGQAFQKSPVDFLCQLSFELSCRYHLKFVLRRVYYIDSVRHNSLFPYRVVCQLLFRLWRAESNQWIAKCWHLAHLLDFSFELIV